MNIFDQLLYNPLLKTLLLFYDKVPGGLGVAVILLTILVKILLLPFNNKATKAQKEVSKLQPKIEEIKEKHKDDQEKMAKETMALYKEAGMNPFSSILLLFIQMPVLFALYKVFREVAAMPEINTFFLGLDLATPNVWLAVASAALFFLQNLFMAPQTDSPIPMKYIYPVLIFIISVKLPGALALYLIVSSIFSIIQLKINE